MSMPPHPPDDHNEPDDVESARAYLRGFDDAQNAADPAKDVGMPEDIVIADVDGRKLIVSPTPTGVIVRGFLGRSGREVRGILTTLNDRGHVVAELDRDNARGLSDALAMAAAVDPER